MNKPIPTKLSGFDQGKAILRDMSRGTGTIKDKKKEKKKYACRKKYAPNDYGSGR